jgi:hypothetical protein
MILNIPAPSDEAMDKIPVETPANILLNQFLYFGSFSEVV